MLNPKTHYRGKGHRTVFVFAVRFSLMVSLSFDVSEEQAEEIIESIEEDVEEDGEWNPEFSFGEDSARDIQRSLAFQLEQSDDYRM